MLKSALEGEKTPVVVHSTYDERFPAGYSRIQVTPINPDTRVIEMGGRQYVILDDPTNPNFLDRVFHRDQQTLEDPYTNPERTHAVGAIFTEDGRVFVD